MITSPTISLVLFGAIILVAAFLGSWFASYLNDRRKIVSIPELAEAETPPESTTSQNTERAREYHIKHAFDFAEDQITMILEMPTAILADDPALADAWIDVVSWARVAWQEIQDGKSEIDAQSPENDEESLNESEITREHLESALQRLHESAERRRALRLKLAERQNGTSQAIAGS